jgi:hypothetical protein
VKQCDCHPVRSNTRKYPEGRFPFRVACSSKLLNLEEGAYEDEIDAITKCDLQVIVVETVAQGNSHDVASAVDSPNYPGLTNSDFPCLWVESGGEHFVIRLPYDMVEVAQIIRTLTDCAKHRKSFKDMEAKFMAKRPQAMRPGQLSSRSPWMSGSFYLACIVVVGALFLVMARTVNVLVLPLVLIASILGVSVVGAFQLRNDEKLKDKPFIELMRLAFNHLPLLRRREEPEHKSGPKQE